MKTEGDSTNQPIPAASATAASTTATTSTPTSGYAATQWSTGSAIPIDPALQQATPAHPTYATTPYQHYQPYTAHYPAYTTPYQPYVPPVAPSTASPTPVSTRQPVQSQTGGGMDTADIATLNDALGSAGVDLRAEEETLQRSHEQHQSFRSYEDRSRKQPSTPNFDTRYLGPTMRSLATPHKITKIPEDSVNYLALALRARLQDLITDMIAASHHRTDAQFDRPASLYEDGSPMWSIVVRSDVAKQLAVLERVEREEETRIRRERKERLDSAAAHAAALAAQANGGASATSAESGFDEEGGVKKKRKKEGPGVTARNMSEDVRKKMSNAVATQAAGLGGKYAWMNASNAAAAAPKPKPATTPAPSTAATAVPTAAGSSSTGATATPGAAGTTGTMGAGGTWARPYVSTKKSATPSNQMSTEEDTRTVVTMRDAVFVISKERGHGGGRGAAKAVLA